MFKLNQNHKGEDIYIEIKEEALIIITELGGEYITEKRMLPERSWESLLEWREEMLLAGQPLAMPRIISEQRVAIAKEEGDVADKGEIGEKESEEMEANLADSERGEEDEKTEASYITQQTIVNAIKSVETRLESQECKVSELIKTVEKMCFASATMMEQFTKIIQEVK
ncbi:uncharacterized protein LOC112638746 [Camponotus floridanus]|uniref:uncharacterized protein LOC112638746 n=1 Tax=Camponotus floridanus TaxID=104421 RepID=UPI000DC6C4BF|nr:uncharacterized protein LOC112638746 [Camponotus floridanus]